jgi:predicted nucleotidyltransferase
MARPSFVPAALSGDEVRRLLTAHGSEFRARFGLERLRVFGSMARHDDTPASDVDLIAAFRGEVDVDRYFGLIHAVEDLVGRRVDLVTETALRPELRARVERDAIDV